MESCTVENWTVEALAQALQRMYKEKKRIAVPMFQRGQRWKKSQQKSFIDSLIKGYPVGTMLFYKTIDDGVETYILVDGLQRGNSIKTYMNNPTEFFYDKNISDDFCKSILQLVDADVPENYDIVRSTLTEFIKEKKSFKNLQYYKPAKVLAQKLSADYSVIDDFIDVIGKFFEERQNLHEQIASTVIPVIVYQGDEENLPEIFDRINSQGTALDPYEVYAASWPTNKRFPISNTDIVECAIKKYDSFIEDGYTIHGYDRETMRTSRKVNAFEYLFGLSKYLVSKYDILGFNKSLPEDTVNPLGFELVNACLNDTDKIKTLYENIYAIDNIDMFERALYTAIEFVASAISTITRFKGNSRSGAKLFHSKYQILSMISTTFKEMYSDGNYTSFSDRWSNRKDMIAQNLRLYYVYDILTKYWSEGGTNKIHAAAKPNRYAIEITPRAWRTALDGFYEKSMSRSESRQIQNPKSEEYVLLNCIYLNTFLAKDQLSIEKFDVEHIAPKEQMKKLIAVTKSDGLPISCIANLCYLPELVNRSKRDRNFYQDTKYLQHINLEEVENKYSFTTREDLEWMDMEFLGEEDADALKQFYTEFCDTRFETLKRLFCKSMGIDFDAMNVVAEEAPTQSEENQMNPMEQRENTAVALYIKLLEDRIGEPLYKIGRSAYRTADKKRGYIVTSSKAYRQGDKQKYWFAYRLPAFENIKNCDEKNILYICKDANEALLYPATEMDRLKDNMNHSTNDDGSIAHWHVVFFRDNGGHMTQMLSKPEIVEIDIDQFKL